MDPETLNHHLSQIETHWTAVFKAHQVRSAEAIAAQAELVRRYGGAVHRYLLASLRDPEAADELSQEFALRFLRGDFKNADPGKGRFRDFLKRAVYRLMVDYHRSRRARPQPLEEAPEPADDAESWDLELDRQFLESWREQLMAHAWSTLGKVQERTGQPFADVLRLRVAAPDLSSAELAERLTGQLGRPVNVGWVRLNLHRARDLFIKSLLDEVKQSLGSDSPQRLEEELSEVGLLEYCQSVLKALRPTPVDLRCPASPTRRSCSIGLTGRLAAMAEADLDRNLLFGVIALQMDFVSRDALLAAIHAWVLEQPKPLDQVLVERGALAEDERGLLEPLVGKHLEKHGDDAERSLAALTSMDWIKHDLQTVAEPDLNVTVNRPTAPGAGVTRPGAARADTPERAGPVGGRFHILWRHARGGLGEVFVALDRDLGREVALKQVLPQYADDSTSRMRFVREAELTGGLEHPGIVPVYAAGSDADGRPYYAMRFIRGDSLMVAIDRFHHGGRPEQSPGERSLERLKLLRQFLDVCNAVDYAHGRGVLHRDLKPSNIIVGKHGETLVVDWGLAKAIGRTDRGDMADEQPLVPSSASGLVETLPGLAMGTPSFMSPEQAAGASSASARSAMCIVWVPPSIAC